MISTNDCERVPAGTAPRPRSLRLAPIGLCLFASTWVTGPICAQELLRFHGNEEVGAIPMWIDGHADMNGDGVSEYVWAGRGLHPLGGLAGVAMFDGASGQRLWFQPHEPGYDAAKGLASVGDIDGDGRRDIAVVAHNGLAGGRCTFLSGTTGTPIGWFEPGTFTASLQGVWDLDDLDGDGISDVLVQWDDFSYRVVSCAPPFPVVYDVPGSSGYGGWASGLDDVDGDGVGDFVVRYGFFGLSPVNVHSAATGAILYTIPVGFDLARCDDVDGDGVGDFCVTGGEDAYILGREHPQIRMLSGVDGSVVWERFSPAPGSSFGFHLGGGGDVNGDGLTDLIVADSAPPESNRLIMRVVDGRTGSILRDIDRADGTPPGGCPPFFFRSVRILGDLDGDGHAEFAGADRDYNECGTLSSIDRGRLYIFKGGPGGEVEPVCDAPPNSTGTPALLRAAGAAQVGSEHFALQLHQAPPHEFTQLAFGPELGPGAPFMQLGAGHLCFDPTGARRVGTPRSTGPAGGTWFFPGWTQDPAIASSWAAGTTWVAQAIFRDTADPAGANTSSAISVNFF